MKKLLAFILSASMAFSSVGTLAAFADGTAATEDIYRLVNVATNATITAEGAGFKLNGDPYLLIDSNGDGTSGNMHTSGVGTNAGDGIIFDLGKAYALSKVNLTADFNTQYFTSKYILYGSNNGTDYTLIKEFTQPADGKVDEKYTYYSQEADVSTAAYRYYKIAPESAETAMSVTDVQLWSSCKVQPKDCERKSVVTADKSKVTSSPSGLSDSGKANLFTNEKDSSNGIIWCQLSSYTVPAAGTDAYIQYDLGAAYTISEFSCQYRGQNKPFKVYASKEENGNYDLIFSSASNTGGDGSSVAKTGTIYLDSPEYRYFRFVRPNPAQYTNAYDQIVAVNALEIYTAEPTEEYWATLDSNEYWFNAALGADVTAYKQTGNSSWEEQTSFPSAKENIVDGRTNTSISTYANYVILDLGRAYELGGFEMVVHYEKLNSNFSLWGSNDQTNWTKLYDIPRTTETSGTLDITGNFKHADYRYVKLDSGSTAWGTFVFNVKELYIYGIGKKNEVENIALGKETKKEEDSGVKNWTVITNGERQDSYYAAAGTQNTTTKNVEYILDLGEETKDVKSLYIGYNTKQNTYYNVYGSADNENWTLLTVFEGNGTEAAGESAVGVKPGDWRYIKIVKQNQDSQGIPLYELEVYASKASGVTESQVNGTTWSFKYANNTAEPFNFVSIAAVYDGDALSNVNVNNETAPAYTTIEKSYTCPASGFKGFLWNSLDTIQSLFGAATHTAAVTPVE